MGVHQNVASSNGNGVIISPRDLPLHLAQDYAPKYLDFGVDLTIDHQFHIPNFTNDNLKSYPESKFRKPVSTLKKILETNLDEFTRHIEKTNKDLNTSALISPSLIYEVGRDDVEEINRNLYTVSKKVGDNLGIPTYKTVIIGNSLTGSQKEINKLLSKISKVKPDGWYVGFEFEDTRIPYRTEYIERFLNTILHFHNTDKPVLNAYAGPLSLLSLAAGANAVGVGHFQNTWHFQRSRWEETPDQQGGGRAPARFFSKYLWGTIIYPDETSRLNNDLREIILKNSQSPFSENTLLGADWSRWDSNKHLIYMIGDVVNQINQIEELSDKINNILQHLYKAVEIHDQISIVLKDETDKYQKNWFDALNNFKEDKQDDIMLSDLLS